MKLTTGVPSVFNNPNASHRRLIKANGIKDHSVGSSQSSHTNSMTRTHDSNVHLGLSSQNHLNKRRGNNRSSMKLLKESTSGIGKQLQHMHHVGNSTLGQNSL